MAGTAIDAGRSEGGGPGASPRTVTSSIPGIIISWIFWIISTCIINARVSAVGLSRRRAATLRRREPNPADRCDGNGLTPIGRLLAFYDGAVRTGGGVPSGPGRSAPGAGSAAQRGVEPV